MIKLFTEKQIQGVLKILNQQAECQRFKCLCPDQFFAKAAYCAFLQGLVQDGGKYDILFSKYPRRID